MPVDSLLDLERFAATPLAREPFDHVIVPGFVPREACARAAADFPGIARGGSFPAARLECGDTLRALIEALQGHEVRRACERKFAIDLDGHPTMVTLRGQSRAKDGRIHTDSTSKLITALIYMNEDWRADGGRLRLLRGPDDIEDYAAEVKPERGTLLAFRCSAHAYHGHKPYIGPRRSIQLNWVTNETVVKRELTRHGLSAWTKRLLGLAAAD